MRSSFYKALMLLALAAAPKAVSAQNCALCYTQAAGSGSRLKQGLRSGILILIFPPMMISTAFIVTSYRRRNRFHQNAVLPVKTDLGW